MPIGSIHLFAFDYPPPGLLVCDGRTVETARYPRLAQAIGNRFGGDGKSTFALPDLAAWAPRKSLPCIAASGGFGSFEPFSAEIGLFPYEFELKGWTRAMAPFTPPTTCAGSPISRLSPCFRTASRKKTDRATASPITEGAPRRECGTSSPTAT
ncbi:MAG TPA: phage tail protein [Thermoanaerobaculia bacterium]|nr:phage tail protein [Thermoanaerobaculia bacterium]